MMKRLAIFFTILLFFTSCNKEKISFKNIYSLTLVDTVEFPLDSLSKADFSQFLDGNNERSIYMLNRFQNAIYKYNYNTLALDSILSFRKSGNANFGTIDAFLVKNSDSIYLYNSNKPIIYLTNRKGEFLKKYEFFQADDVHLTPEIDNQNKAFFNDGKLYFTHRGLRKAYKKNVSFPNTTVSSLNLDDGSFDFELPFPDVYKNKVWGLQFYNLTSTFNPKNKTRVYSYMINENILTIDSLGNIKTYYAGSEHFDKTNPISEKELDFMEVRQEVNIMYSSSYFYNIYYDQFNDMYFRFAFLPIYQYTEAKNLMLSELVREKRFSVVILNKDFVKQGEYILPNLSYDINNVFFTENGMHILNKNSEEDIMKYDIYNLNKNKNED